MKTGAIVRSYCITEYLERVLKSLEGIDSIAVMNYRFNGVGKSEDNTPEIISRINKPNITLYKGEGLDQHEIFNKGLEILKDCDFVFIIDADEFLLKADRDRIIEDMIKKGFGFGFANVLDYKDMNNIYPLRTHKPVVCVKSGESDVFYEIRNVMGASGSKIPNVYLHHFGYALNEGNLKWKKDNLWYSVKEEFDRIISQECKPYTMPEELKEIING